VIPSSPFIEGSSDVPPPIPTSDRGEDEKERNAAHARRTRKKPHNGQAVESAPPMAPSPAPSCGLTSLAHQSVKNDPGAA
jgi:hypothetical protein